MKVSYTTFATYPDSPRPWSFFGTSGFWSVPSGHQWYAVVDKNGQMWVSDAPLTRNNDGTVSETAGHRKYAADLNCDYTLVFVDGMANRKTGIDSPAPDRLSQLP